MIYKKELHLVKKEYITDFVECDICKVRYHTNLGNDDGSINIEDTTEEYGHAREFDNISGGQFIDTEGDSFAWCRKLKPEDVGFTYLKPSWDDAPEWANWLAQDENGEWYWYEDMPVKRTNYWIVEDCKHAGANVDNWKNTLEERPKNG